MPEDLVLGIDASTTAIKALVFDLAGHPIQAGRSALAVRMSRPGWHEQSAGLWWGGLIRALSEALKGIRVERLVGLAIAHQRESFVPLDRRGKPLRPALLWMDERAADLLPEFAQALGGQAAFQRLTGKPLTANLSVMKIAWLKQHEPEIFSRAAWYLDVHAYLVHQLTGNFSTSWGSADPTGLFDMQRQDWAGQVLDALSISAAQLPRLYPPGSLLGKVTRAAARLSGLPEGLPVVAGLGDGQAGGVGANISSPGSAYLSLGTSVITGTFSDRYVTGQAFRTMGGGAPGDYLLETVLLGGSYTLEWLFKVFLGKRGRSALKLRQQMEQALDHIPPGAEGLVLLPYWNTVMNPYWDASASGLVMGWRGIHRPLHLYRAILEGIAMELRLHFAGVEAALHRSIDHLVAMGGGASSDPWLQIIADATQKPVYRSQAADAVALGAAILAAWGCGCYPSLAKAANQMSAWTPQAFEPRDPQAAFYTQLYERTYRPLFPAVRASMQALAEIQAEMKPLSKLPPIPEED